jgi:hypothetical protein
VDFLNHIVEYENVFSEEELEQIRQPVFSPRWEITNSNPEQGERTFWRMNLMNDKLFTNKLFKKIQKIVDVKAELHDVYFNGTTTSMASAAHIDAREHNVYVMLVYLNPEWHIQWGGQTVFLNTYFDVDANEMRGDNRTKSYFPRFNFGLCFPGNIVHLAEAPTRDYYGLRLTLAYRFKIL